MLAASVCVATQVQGGGSAPGATVGPGQVVSGEVSGSESHVYTVTLESGTALRARLLQNGIDLAVNVLDPGGVRVTSVDGTGVGEPEVIDLTATESGEYTLVVRAFDPGAMPGRFTLVGYHGPHSCVVDLRSSGAASSASIGVICGLSSTEPDRGTVLSGIENRASSTQRLASSDIGSGSGRENRCRFET